MLLVPVLLVVAWLGILLSLHRSGRLKEWRWLAYVAALVLLTPAGFLFGWVDFDRRVCSRPDVDGDCDLGPLAGLYVVAAFWAVWLVTIAALEIGFARQRRVVRT